MQTLRDSAFPTAGARMRVRMRTVIAAIAACVAVAPFAGCASSASLPRLQSQVDDVTALSTCESAYLTAVSGTTVRYAGKPSDANGASGVSGTTGVTDTTGTHGTTSDTTGTTTTTTAPTFDALPAMMRYFAARTSADAWTTVAVGCTGRFAEGTLHAAQASYVAQSLASRLGLPGISPETVDYGDVVGLDIDPSVLSALSLAEDRAGFAVEVLAARKVAGATLAMSDNHKTAAQHLFTLSGEDKDPRQKVYTVDSLVAHPDSLGDPANGIAANTVSVIEMNCAREYLDAVAGATGDGDASGDSADSAAAKDGSGTTDTASSGSGSSSGSASAADKANTADDGNENAVSAIRASDKTLRWLSRMASARAWRAFDLGYPAFNAALFD